MNPPLFSFRGANIEQKSDSANFFSKKNAKKRIFHLFYALHPIFWCDFINNGAANILYFAAPLLYIKVWRAMPATLKFYQITTPSRVRGGT